MEDNNVVGVVEVLGQGVDVLTAQPVGHEDRRSVSVCPVDPILQPTDGCCLTLVFKLVPTVCKLALNAIQVESERVFLRQYPAVSSW